MEASCSSEISVSDSKTADCRSTGGHNMNRLRLIEIRVLKGTFGTRGRKRPNEDPNKKGGSRIYTLHRVSLGRSNHGA